MRTNARNTHQAAISLMTQSRGDLRTLLSKVQELERLTAKIMPYIDEPFRAHIRVAYDFQDTITFMTASSAIATRLHSKVDELLRRFSAHAYLQHIKTIHVKIQSHDTPSRLADAPRKAPMAQKAFAYEQAETVREMANSMSDTKLRDIMQRIANHLDGTA